MTPPYIAAATALMRLGRTLAAVGADRYTNPPKLMSVDPRPSNRAGISTPTVDTTVDDRRWRLSGAMTVAESWLTDVARAAHAHADTIDAAHAAWRNDDPEDADV